MNQMLNHYDFKSENGEFHIKSEIKSEDISYLHSEYDIKVENISNSEAESENENLESTNSLIQHEIQEEKNYLKKHVCFVCKKNYPDNELLETHLQIHFKNGSPYKCKKCNKRINHISNFKRHIRVHTGEKPHECEICMQSFNTSWQLKVHRERSHLNIKSIPSIRKPKTYQCDKCEKSFHDNGHLQEHMKFHGTREFKCQHCGKSYFTKSILRRHISLIHKLERKHKCELCGKQYGTSWDLKVHNNMVKHDLHRNVKGHVVCDICNKILSCQSKFKRHLKIHIQIE